MGYQIDLRKITFADIKRLTGEQPVTMAELKEFLDCAVIGGIANIPPSEMQTVLDEIVKEFKKFMARLDHIEARRKKHK